MGLSGAHVTLITSATVSLTCAIIILVTFLASQEWRIGIVREKFLLFMLSINIMLYAVAFIIFAGDSKEDLNYYQCNFQASMIQCFGTGIIFHEAMISWDLLERLMAFRSTNNFSIGTLSIISIDDGDDLLNLSCGGMSDLRMTNLAKNSPNSASMTSAQDLIEKRPSRGSILANLSECFRNLFVSGAISPRYLKFELSVIVFNTVAIITSLSLKDAYGPLDDAGYICEAESRRRFAMLFFTIIPLTVCFLFIVYCDVSVLVKLYELMKTTNEEYNDYIMSPENQSSNSLVQKVLNTKEGLVDTYRRLDEKSKSTFRRLVFTSVSYSVTGFIVSLYAYLAPQGVEGPCATNAAGIISLIGWVIVDTAAMRDWYYFIFGSGLESKVQEKNAVPSVTLVIETDNPVNSH